MDGYFVFVKKLAEAFDGAGLDYAFTGALAVSYYGVPRTTSDVDILVEAADEVDLKTKIASALRQVGLEVDERKIDMAIVSGYKIVTFACVGSPYTVDVILSNGKLDKRVGKIDSLSTFFQSPEGLILAKLRMIKATLAPERAAKDKEDVKSVLAFTKVNIESVKKQAKKDATLEILADLTE